MNQQKQLLVSIALMEQYVRQEQVKLAKHKRYFGCFLRDHQTVFSSLLFVFVFTGWHMTNRRNTGELLKQAVKMTLLSVTTLLRKWYLS